MSAEGYLLRSRTKPILALFTSADTVRLRGLTTSRFVLMPRTRRLLARQPALPMPEVSRFYGIMIRFYFRDHPPTHFHAIYGEYEALIEIETGAIYRGRLPRTAYDLVN